MPAAASPDTFRTIYLFEGESMTVAGEALAGSTGAVLRSDIDVVLAAGSRVECLVLQGRPIGEPVTQYGPFVMSDEDGIRDAFADYRRTGFGGWPWPDDGPVHGAAPERFARRPDGTVQTPGCSATVS